MTTFATHSRYKLMSVVCLALAALFGWTLRTSDEPAVLFFCVACLVMAAWFGRAIPSRVVVTQSGVQLQTPFSRERVVEYRQLISVTEDGRLNRAITLLYHPKRSDGLLDLEDAQSLHLPAMDRHDELLTLLEAKTPV